MVERIRYQKFFSKPSLTRQEFKDEADLGKTIKRFAKTPEGRRAIMNAQVAPGRYEDVSSVPDYRTALEQVELANRRFMALPALVRKRFDNDAALFLDFCSDPRNLPELRKLGLANPEVVKPVEGGSPNAPAG